MHVPIHQFFFEVSVTRLTCIVDGFLAIFIVVVGWGDEERLGAEKNAEAIRRGETKSVVTQIRSTCPYSASLSFGS